MILNLNLQKDPRNPFMFELRFEIIRNVFNKRFKDTT